MDKEALQHHSIQEMATQEITGDEEQVNKNQLTISLLLIGNFTLDEMESLNKVACARLSQKWIQWK